MIERTVSFREDEQGRKFPFIDLGSEDHGRPSFRLWIAGRLVSRGRNNDYVVRFPVRGAKVEVTEKGNRVLRPTEGWIVYDVYEECGYRGKSRIMVLAPGSAEIHYYAVYRSPRGNLGISEGALVCVPEEATLKYRYERTGRTYGAPQEGVVIVNPEGERKEFDWIPDGLAAIEELPTMED